jgi:hypothetical protein
MFIFHSSNASILKAKGKAKLFSGKPFDTNIRNDSTVRPYVGSQRALV